MTSPAPRLMSATAAYLRAIHADDMPLARAITKDVGADKLLPAVAGVFVYSLEGTPEAVAAVFDEIEGDLVYQLPRGRR